MVRIKKNTQTDGIVPVLLIPGYGTGVTRSIFKRKVSPLRGFEVFKNKPVQVFKWGSKKTYTVWQTLNPAEAIRLYKLEREQVYTPQLQESLYSEIHTYKPKVIIAHSLGSVLITEIFKKHSIQSLNKLIFVQSDLRGSEINNCFVKHTVKSKVELINIYCPWDQALLSSWFLQRSKPLGLGSHPLFENHFIPLWRTWNLHESTLCDPKLLDLALP